MNRSPFRIACIAASLCALAACGSTVSLGASSGQPGLSAVGSGSGLVGTASQATEGSGATAGVEGPTIPSMTSTDAATSSSSGSGGAGGKATTVATSGLKSTAPIEVGVPYLDTSSTNALVGAIGAGLAENDLRQLYEEDIADLNAKGGVLGRKIKGIYLKLDPSKNQDQLGQEACTYFTQDHKVPIVLATDLGGTLYPCLTKHHVAALASGISETYRPHLAANPLAVMPDNIGMDRLSEILVPNLDEMGYFSKKPTDKLGIAYFDNPATVEGFKIMKSELAKRGYTVGDSVSIKMASGTSDIAAMEAAVKSAELKFKADGVTHVMCVETRSFICGFFAIYAGQQNYYPRYAYSSAQSIASIVANASARSLAGSLFVGWHGSQDLQRETDMTPSLRACVKFFRKNGQTIDTGNKYEQAARVCEDVNYLVAALKLAPAVTGPGFVQGALKVGASFAPVDGFGTNVAAHRDGATAVRRGLYIAGCGCFQYTGSVSHV